MKIGIIGCGNIGGALARQWVKAGHEVILSSRHPDKLSGLAQELGSNASIGTPERAASEGEIVLLSIPLGGVQDLSDAVCNALRGKIVMDTGNPYPERDGEAAREVFREGRGTGVWMSHQLPGARLVRAFNTVPVRTIEGEAHRFGDPIGVPLASDDVSALQAAATLVRDAGFGPLIIGALERAREFDPGTRPYASNATVSELEGMLEPMRPSAVLRAFASGKGGARDSRGSERHRESDREQQEVSVQLSQARTGLKAIQMILLTGVGAWLAYRIALRVKDWKEARDLNSAA